MNFIYLDLLMMENWMPSVLKWINENHEEIEDRPLNNFFEDNGFGSMLFINNIGSGIIYLLIYTILLFLLGLLKIFNFICSRSSNFYEDFKQKMIWSWTLALFNNQFVPFLTGCIINSYQI